MARRWNEEEIEYLRNNYAYTPNSILSKEMKRSRNTIIPKARLMGLKKKLGWQMERKRIKTKPLLKKYEWSYLAGLIDGEGTIGLYKVKKNRKNYYLVPRITFSNTNKYLGEWICRKMNKKISHYNIKKDNDNLTNGYIIEIGQNHRECLEMIDKLKPFIIAKLPQLILLERAINIRLNQNVRERYDDRILDIMEKIHILNSTGKRKDKEKREIREELKLPIIKLRE
jgi:hypothetical protein